MKEGQKEIYYLVGPNREAIEAGPYLEGFRARNLEVLFCYENVDEYVMTNVHEFDGKRLLAADHADVKLEDLPKPPEEGALTEEQTTALTGWLKETLGERVSDVKTSDRLVDSPALALNADKFMSPHMRRLMKAMKTEGAEDSPPRVELQINPRHPLIKHLAAERETKPEVAKMVAEQVLDNALIAAGLLDDPQKMVARIYKLLESI
jgi:molecular chaperone HtpG